MDIAAKKNRLKDLKSKIMETSLVHGSGLINTSFTLSEQNMNMEMLHQVINQCNKEEFYHKFIITNPDKDLTRHVILKAVLDFLHPVKLTPLYFRNQGNLCFFLATDCQEAIMRIISARFKIPNPLDEDKLFNVIIICNFFAVANVPNKPDNLKKVLKERFKENNKFLNLNNLCLNEDLPDYYPVYVPKVMLKVMSEASELAPSIVGLQNNFLKDINSIYPLNKTELVGLDLRNNEISSLEDIECLEHFVNLRTLYLTGNPICNKYDSYNYVLVITSICKSLKVLDLFNLNKPPTFRKNFVCTPEAQYFASQFMEHFFTVYDSNKRDNLEDLYDKDALFSVASRIIPSQMNSDSTDLTHYGLKEPFAVHGVANILEVFDEFPQSLHDPYTFVCDVLFYEFTFVALSIGGLFREGKDILSFTRTFILKRNCDEFLITNDQLLVQNAKDIQLGWGFRFPSPHSYLPYFSEQYKMIVDVFHKLTTMRRSFCERYLFHYQYDLVQALKGFCNLHRFSKIPDVAFRPDKFNTEESTDSFHLLLRHATEALHSSVSPKTVWLTLEQERMKKWTNIVKSDTINKNKIYRKNLIEPEQMDTPKKKSKGYTRTLINIKPNIASPFFQTSSTSSSSNEITEQKDDQQPASSSDQKKSRLQGCIKINIPPPVVSYPTSVMSVPPPASKPMLEKPSSIYKLGYVAVNDKALEAVTKSATETTKEKHSAALETIKNTYGNKDNKTKTDKTKERKKISMEIKKLPKPVPPPVQTPTTPTITKPPVLVNEPVTTNKNQKPQSKLVNQNNQQKNEKSGLLAKIQTSLRQKDSVTSIPLPTALTSQPSSSMPVVAPLILQQTPIIPQMPVIPQQTPIIPQMPVIPQQTPLILEPTPLFTRPTALLPDPPDATLEQTLKQNQLIALQQSIMYSTQVAVMYQNHATGFTGGAYLPMGYYDQYQNAPLYSIPPPQIPTVKMHEEDPEQDYLPCPLAKNTDLSLPVPPGEEDLVLSEGNKTTETKVGNVGTIGSNQVQSGNVSAKPLIPGIKKPPAVQQPLKFNAPVVKDPKTAQAAKPSIVPKTAATKTVEPTTSKEPAKPNPLLVVHPIEETFNNILVLLVQIKYNGWSPNEGQKQLLKHFVKRMYFFVQRLEKSLQTSDKRVVPEKDVNIMKITGKEPLANVIQSVGYSVLHVIFHEMFEHKQCQYNKTTKPNVSKKPGSASSMHICMNEVYSDDCCKLLRRIRTELHSKQDVFKNLRFLDEIPKQTSDSMAGIQETPKEFMKYFKNVVSNNLMEMKRKKICMAFVPNKLCDVLTITISSFVFHLDDNYYKELNILYLNKLIDYMTVEVRRQKSKDFDDEVILTLFKGILHVVVHDMFEHSTCMGVTNMLEFNAEQSDSVSAKLDLCNNKIYEEKNAVLLELITKRFKYPKKFFKNICYKDSVKFRCYRGFDLSKTLQDVSQLVPFIYSNDSCHEIVSMMLKSTVLLKDDPMIQETLNYMTECAVKIIRKLVDMNKGIKEPEQANKDVVDLTLSDNNQDQLNEVLGIDMQKVEKMHKINKYLPALKNLLHVINHELIENSPCLKYKANLNLTKLPTALCITTTYKSPANHILKVVRQAIYEAEFKLKENKEIIAPKEASKSIAGGTIEQIEVIKSAEVEESAKKIIEIAAPQQIVVSKPAEVKEITKIEAPKEEQMEVAKEVEDLKKIVEIAEPEQTEISKSTDVKESLKMITKIEESKEDVLQQIEVSKPAEFKETPRLTIQLQQLNLKQFKKEMVKRKKPRKVKEPKVTKITKQKSPRKKIKVEEPEGEIAKVICVEDNEDNERKLDIKEEIDSGKNENQEKTDKKKVNEASSVKEEIMKQAEEQMKIVVEKIQLEPARFIKVEIESYDKSSEAAKRIEIKREIDQEEDKDEKNQQKKEKTDSTKAETEVKPSIQKETKQHEQSSEVQEQAQTESRIDPEETDADGEIHQKEKPDSTKTEIELQLDVTPSIKETEQSSETQEQAQTKRRIDPEEMDKDRKIHQKEKPDSAKTEIEPQLDVTPSIKETEQSSETQEQAQTKRRIESEEKEKDKELQEKKQKMDSTKSETIEEKTSETNLELASSINKETEQHEKNPKEQVPTKRKIDQEEKDEDENIQQKKRKMDSPKPARAEEKILEVVIKLEQNLSIKVKTEKNAEEEIRNDREERNISIKTEESESKTKFLFDIIQDSDEDDDMLNLEDFNLFTQTKEERKDSVSEVKPDYEENKEEKLQSDYEFKKQLYIQIVPLQTNSSDKILMTGEKETEGYNLSEKETQFEEVLDETMETDEIVESDQRNVVESENVSEVNDDVETEEITKNIGEDESLEVSKKNQLDIAEEEDATNAETDKMVEEFQQSHSRRPSEDSNDLDFGIKFLGDVDIADKDNDGDGEEKSLKFKFD